MSNKQKKLKPAMSVLVVDDNPENLVFLRILLEHHGYTVQEAHHGAEALSMARESLPDLIISDLQMPVMDGYTLLRQWKADEELKNIPFIVYTATYKNIKDEILALDLGADAFIIKPAESKLFLARISEVLAKSERGELTPANKQTKDETTVQKEYSNVLTHKLEEKAIQLEQSNFALQKYIEQRKIIEEELLKSEEKYRTIFESVRDVIYTISPEGNFLSLNPEFEHVTGWSAGEWINKSFIDFVHPDDLHLATAAFMDVMAGKNVGVYELRIRTKSGEYRTGEFTPTQLMYRNEIVGTLGIARDITERKRTEEQMQQSQREYKTLADNAPDVVLRFDRELRHSYANKAYEESTGFTPEKYLNKTDREMGMPDALVDFWEKEITKVFETASKNIIEFEIPLPDGTHLYEARLAPEFLEDGSVGTVLVISRDITERKRNDAKIKEQLEELQRWHKVTLGREEKIIQLKHEVNDLLRELGKSNKYQS